MKPVTRSLSLLFAGLACACSSVGPATPATSTRPKNEFSFAVLSDTHVEPRFRDQPPIPPEQERGAETFAWLARTLHEPQSLPTIQLDAPAPDLALVCGDLTEFGAIDDTWSALEKQLDTLAIPWFAAAGNHDLTWSPTFEGFEKKFGGLAYSFDRGGAHFIALCSASPCEPLPSFSELQLSWLRSDLAKNNDRKPVFVFMHHPPDSAELAPSQLLELRAALDGHEIAALFHGHGHQVESRNLAGLDCVQTGSTFASGSAAESDARGFALASIADGKLRVVYRYFNASREPKLLLEKKLVHRQHVPFAIVEPAPGAPARGHELNIVLRAPQNAELRCRLDGEAIDPKRRLQRDGWHISLPLAGLAGGVHQFVATCDDDGLTRLCTLDFIAPSDSVQMLWRRNFAGSLRAPPVFAGRDLAVASSAGELAVLDAANGQLRWSVKTAAVLGAPLCDQDGAVAVGTTQGWVESYDPAGQLRWRFQLGKPVLAGLAGNDELIFAADADGRIHAIERASGSRRWLFDGTRGPVEARPTLDGDRLLFGAWDGFVRALDSRRGELLWSSIGASSQRRSASRYFSPADVPMVAAGDGFWTVDRGGVLSKFDRTGGRTDFDLPKAASVAAAPNGGALNLRLKESGLMRLDTEGRELSRWNVATGRIPAAPSEAAGRIAVVSDRGLVSLIDGASGSLLWSWRATAGGYVFAAPLLAADGTVWVAAVDGSLSCLRAR